MRKTLYLKFILAYLIFGFFGFVVVATFVSSLTLDHVKKTAPNPSTKRPSRSPTLTPQTFTAIALRWTP